MLLQTCCKTSSTVFLPVLTQAQKAQPLSRQLCWRLRSTVHHLGHTLTAAIHNENKPLTAGLERFQQGSSLGALKLPGPRSTGLDCGEMKLPETSLSRVQIPPGKGQALAAAALVRTWDWFLKQPCAAFPSRVAAGVISVPVRGKLDPRDALHKTLEGLQPWERVGKLPWHTPLHVFLWARGTSRDNHTVRRALPACPMRHCSFTEVV